MEKLEHPEDGLGDPCNCTYEMFLRTTSWPGRLGSTIQLIETTCRYGTNAVEGTKSGV